MITCGVRIACACALLVALGAQDPAPEQPLRFAACDDLVRPPVLFRCDIQRAVDSADFASGPFTLTVSLTCGTRNIASTEVILSKLGDLRQGVRIALAPAPLDPTTTDHDAILRVTLANVAHSRVERLTRELPTPQGAVAALVRLGAQARERGEIDPLPNLWLEQGDEIAHSANESAHFRELAEILARLRAWSAGERPHDGPGSSLRAWRDPVDGSIQPARWHVAEAAAAAGRSAAQALFLGNFHEPPSKARWPGAPQAWWTAANRAGTSVGEVYPAGDTAFTGIALLRAEQQLAAIATAGPAAIIGEGAGAAAAIRLACVHPDSVSALLLIDPQLPGDLACMPHGIPIRVSGNGNPAFRAWRQQSLDIRGSDDDTAPPTDPAFWTAPAAASSTRSTARQMSAVCSTIGPLCGYARGPFVVVVGTGEHLAAQQDDRWLAAQFVAAWSAHAQGVPPMVDDSAFDAKQWSGHHWVLIGNTRSNRVIADLVRSGLRLPVTWDSRSLTVIDDDQRSTYLRAEMRPIAIAMPRPADPAHTLVLLDGAPAWSGRGLPLAGLPALTVGQPMIPLK